MYSLANHTFNNLSVGHLSFAPSERKNIADDVLANLKPRHLRRLDALVQAGQVGVFYTPEVNSVDPSVSFNPNDATPFGQLLMLASSREAAQEALGASGDGLITLVSVDGILEVDCSAGSNFYTVMHEDAVLTLVNEPEEGTVGFVSLEIVQHASAAKTLGFPVGWKWLNAAVGEISTDVGVVDELNLIIRNPAGTPLHRAALAKGWA